MRDERKTKAQVLDELRILRAKLKKAEKAKAQRKHAEAVPRGSEERYKTMFESAPLAINITRDTEITYANPAYLKMFGFSDLDELRSRAPLELFSPESRSQIQERIQDRAKGRPVSNSYEAECIKKDGTKFSILMNLTRMTFADGPATVAFIVDITERKRVDQALREKEELFSLFIRHSPVFAYIKEATPTESRVVQASDNFDQMIGISGSDMIGKTMEELFPREFAATITADDWAVVTGGKVLQQEEELNGRHFETIKFPIVQGEKTLLAGYTIDITERKRVEEQIQDSEEQFRQLFDNMRAGVMVCEVIFDESGVPCDHRLVRANPAFEMLTGLSIKERIGKIGKDMGIGWPPEVVQRLYKVAMTREPIHYERFNETLGRFYETMVFSPRHGQFAHVFTDITDRKNAEKKVLESEMKFRASFMTGLDASYIATLEEGLIIEANSAIEELFGYSREEFIGRTSLDLGLYHHPTDRAKVVADLKTKGFVKDVEVEGRKKSGEVIMVSLSISTLLIEGQNHILGVIRDITERKRAEQALRESEERFRALFEQAAVGVALLETTTGRYIQINQRYCDFLGYTLEEMLHKTLQDVTHPDDAQSNLDGNASLIAGKITEFSIEKRYIRKDGTVVWGNLTASPLWKPGEQPDAYLHIAVVKDITERKQMQKELRESEARFRTLIEQSPVAVSLSREGKGMYANTKLMQLFGLGSAEEYSGSTVTEYFAPRAREASRERTRQRAHGFSSASEYESVLARKDGSEFPVQITVTTVELADGPANMAFITDITERKRAEEALRESEGRLRDIIFSMADWVWEVDEKGRYTYSSQKGFELFGPIHDDVIGKTPFDFMPSDEAQRVGAIFSEIAANKLPIKDLENWNISRTGERICLLTNGVPILDEQGNLKGYRGVDKDITERKRTEDALRASESRFRDLWGATVEGLTILDGGTIVEVNDAICQMFGTTREQAVGKSFLSFAPPEMHESLRKRVTSGTEGRFETPALRADGATIILEVFTKRFIYHGKPMRMAAMRDITERKRAEETLKKERALLSTIIETIPDEICLKDTDSRYIMANKASVMALGAKSLEEMLGKTDLEYVRRDIALRLLAEEKQILESGKPMIAREVARVDPKTGEISKCDLYTKVPVKAQDGTTVGLLVINMDITQRKRAEENVKRSELRLRQLSAHLESVREEERKHIAQEFHDQLGQTLTALKMDLSLMERSIADEKKEISRAALIEEMHSSQKLIDRGIQTVRTIMSELRPELLDQLGLVEALEWEVGKFQRRSGVVCELTADVGDLQLDARRSIALFRLVQEALTNVARHAQASKVAISLRTEGDDLILEVKDDGIGISFDAESKPRSFGLIGMRERAVFLGGNLEITGTVGKGTTIVVRMPIHETLPDGGV